MKNDSQSNAQQIERTQKKFEKIVRTIAEEVLSECRKKRSAYNLLMQKLSKQGITNKSGEHGVYRTAIGYEISAILITSMLYRTLNGMDKEKAIDDTLLYYNLCGETLREQYDLNLNEIISSMRKCA